MRTRDLAMILTLVCAACSSSPTAPVGTSTPAATNTTASGAPATSPASGSSAGVAAAGRASVAGATAAASGSGSGGSGGSGQKAPPAAAPTAGNAATSAGSVAQAQAGSSAGASVAGASGSAGLPSAAGSGTGSAGAGSVLAGGLPFQMDVNTKGTYAVTTDQRAGANSWVFRPTDLGKDGVKHPIFVFGCGATSTPSQYVDHWTMVASHGFVVISPNNSSVDAPAMKASLDWIIAQNDVKDSPYYQKLNTKKIAMGGHSLGSIATFDQEAMETRLTTTIHIAGGSFDGMGSSKVKTPTAYMCGQMDQDIASPQCKTDFDNVKNQPTYFVQLAGVDHVGAARQALPGIIGWLRWYLNDEDRKSMFVGPGCDFCKDKWANAKTKNF